jgi:dethiobiotin synthetase
MTAIFVTATGTDIGKTFVTAGLIHTMTEMGKKAHAVKPVVSGFSDATAAISDPGILLDAMGDALTPEALDRVSPWRFAAPLAPHMAAAREGRAIDFGELIAFCRAEVARRSGVLFVEGVGGVMVPLDDRRTTLDWMKALGIPVLLVTGSYLGTISHTLTALDALAHARVAVKAIVVNDSADDAVPIADTCDTLRQFAGANPIVTLPRVKSWRNARDAFAKLASCL